MSEILEDEWPEKLWMTRYMSGVFEGGERYSPDSPLYIRFDGTIQLRAQIARQLCDEVLRRADEMIEDNEEPECATRVSLELIVDEWEAKATKCESPDS